MLVAAAAGASIPTSVPHVWQRVAIGAVASLLFSRFEMQATSFSLNPAHSLVLAVPSGHSDRVWI